MKYDALADEPMEQGGELRVGVIGVGNMGGALVRGILARGLTSGQNVIVSDLDEKKVAELVDDLGVRSAAWAYLGGIRMPPSTRMTSPFMYGLVINSMTM